MSKSDNDDATTTMNKSFIDDNGNPCDENEGILIAVDEDGYCIPEEIINVGGGVHPHPEQPAMYLPGNHPLRPGQISPPKYFINAAELSEEEHHLLKLSESGEKSKPEVAVAPKPIRPRSRVPVSKSYPDIVQTTLNKEKAEKVENFLKPRMELNPENSDMTDSVVIADSLENLNIVEKEKVVAEESAMVVEKKAWTNYDDRPVGRGLGNNIMASSALMTESQQMGGIIGEKPPEAWVIDINSISSLELEGSPSQVRRARRGSGSNASSLAFFVNMDNDNDEGAEKVMSTSVGGGAEKKMFSMFVDMKEDNEQGESKSQKNLKSQIPNLKKGPPHHHHQAANKAVLSVMETSSTGSCCKGQGSSSSLSKKFPSPIFHHKAAAEAARQAARSDWEKQREKYYDSLDPAIAIGGALGESTLSNRSSLHVANYGLGESFCSSIISSMETSQPEEMEICQGGACFKLQLDLTRMFQEGINTDVIIGVNGKYIRAHKCILASRSQYFAAILSGHWVEKAGNTINLDGFSYCVVQFALYHIYSGTNEIPETIDLLELAMLTDLLGLEGLRENISQTFRVKFCHNFHRPCTGCITGVLECFPIAVNYGMDELHRKMIKWICKHFVRIWPTKGFASLGEDLIEKCLKYSINHLSVDNILDHTLGCDQLTTTMPSLRWTETIFNIVHQLGEECVQFVGENFSDVLQSQKFLQFGKGQAWNISRIEDTFMQSLTLLKPDMACLAHTALMRLIELGTETIDDVEWSTSFVDFLQCLRSEVEKYLMSNASKAVLSKCWEELSQSFRKKICSSSFVGYDKFGNKVVKNNGGSGAAATTTKQKGSGQNSTSKPVAAGRNMSTTGASKSSAKVASVKPMQSNHHQEEDEHEYLVPKGIEHNSKVGASKPIPVPRTTSGVVRTLSNLGKGQGETTTQVRAGSGRASGRSHHGMVVVDKPYHTPGSRKGSMGGEGSPIRGSRTPGSKAQTPCGAGPGRGFESTAAAGIGRAATPTGGSRKMGPATARNHALARQQSKPPPEPPKKSFLTNSAKAAAVSKPILRGNQRIGTPSGSEGSSSIGGGSNPSPPPISRHNSTSKSGGERATSFGAGSGGSVRRSSFTAKVERPRTTPSGRGPASNNTRVVVETQRKITTPVARSNPSKISNVSSVNRPSSGAAVNRNTVGGRGKAGNIKTTPTTTTTTTHYGSMLPNLDSFQPDSLMSRSSIEMESEEGGKMRTLAQIGRSSTFSKDEPTILGKMEGSGYGQGVDNNRDGYYDDYE